MKYNLVEIVTLVFVGCMAIGTTAIAGVVIYWRFFL